ncbi:hypothetical protein [Anabaena subtropica]|uniref:Uncharacterized protein n=1 Tax=Anabaena subtropica FACHB-260 TaxID=2692884 RepID=A0ABR8CJ69_9NOST|nr:hypothetical protein [Anabaena subtropica]MBD2342568.1 hypothetical protein [Anabaena subtropica FACHB-260]
MQPDLIGLEISKGELRRLTGVSPDKVPRPGAIASRQQRLKFWQDEISLVLILAVVIVGLVYGLIILPTIGSAISLGIILFIIVAVLLLLGRSLWQRLKISKSLIKLLDAVDQYHALIVAVDVNDQLAVCGNLDNSLEDRVQVITALQLLREDLVQALKTERLLRDNKKLLANQQELFVNHLTNIQAIKEDTQASEYGQIINQLLQIGLDAQAELRKLQSSR